MSAWKPPVIGHAPYWEAPDAFNRIVLDFLRDVETAAAGTAATA
jgi:pimeloyl-ACP methyl ester carboxylesterase